MATRTRLPWRAVATPHRLGGVILGLALTAGVVASAAPQTEVPGSVPLEPTVRVRPAEVPLDLLYHGASLHVQGWVPIGTAAAVLCVGVDQPLHLKRKGRVWGLWMNAGEVSFGGVPSVYLLKTSAPLDGLAAAEALREHALGYEGLRSRIARSDATGENDLELFPELVRLKEHEGVFRVDEGVLRMAPAGHGLDTFETTFFLPARVPPASYEVRLYAFHDRTVELLGRAATELRPAGAAAFIAAAARHRGLLYGIVAVLVAMAAGLLTGLLFGLGGKRGQAH